MRMSYCKDARRFSDTAKRDDVEGLLKVEWYFAPCLDTSYPGIPSPSVYSFLNPIIHYADFSAALIAFYIITQRCSCAGLSRHHHHPHKTSPFPLQLGSHLYCLHLEHLLSSHYAAPLPHLIFDQTELQFPRPVSDIRLRLCHR